MVDKASLGTQGVPFKMDIERGKIREFAEAIFCEHPSYMTSENPPCPPTFLTSQFFWERWTPGADPWDAVKMDQERGMHAEQEYIFHGPPPRAGTQLQATSRIDSITEKEGRRGGLLTFVVKITEFRDENGRLVAESHLTGVETGQAPKEG